VRPNGSRSSLAEAAGEVHSLEVHALELHEMRNRLATDRERAAMSTPAIALLLANTGSTLYMTGLIWFVQIVHYPLFAAVGRAEFPAYSRAHQTLTTLVVGPPMLVEALTAGLLIVMRPPAVPAWAAWTGLVLVGIIWISTATMQVPSHARLVGGFDESTGAFLVHSNWIRTAAWSARGALVLWMLWLCLAPAAEARA
jgi:hypothetical protein